MGVGSWLKSLRESRHEKVLERAAETNAEAPEKQRFSSVDIAGHSAAAEAKRLSGEE
jgi:hypothetical protein